MFISRFLFLSVAASLVITAGCNPAQCPDGFVMDAAGTCTLTAVDAAPRSDGGMIVGDGGMPDGDGGMVGPDAFLRDACIPAPEACNMRDDDCDGMTDEGAATTYYLDADGDGFGDPMRSAVACAMPPGHVVAGTDCDDLDHEISPAITDACDGVDNDCSGEPDDAFTCSAGEAVACATACGTTGSGTCTASCGAPTTCTPPRELCNRVDEDCDGAIDEGSRALGAPSTMTSTGTDRVVTLPTTTGFISFYSTTGGIRAQRIAADGARDGGELTVVSGSRPDSFDVTISGSNYAIVYRRGTTGMALLMNRTTLVGTTPTAFATFASATTHFELVAGEGRLAAVYSDGTNLRVASRSVPSFGSERSTTIRATTSQEFDAVGSGPRAYVAYMIGANLLVLGSIDLADDHVSVAWAFVTDAAVERRSPAIFVADVGTGVPQIGVAYNEPGAPVSSGVFLALYDVAVSGSVTERSTTRVLGIPTSGGLTVPTSVVASDGVDLVWGAGRWVVSAFQGASSGAASSWQFAEVNGAGEITRGTVETSTSSNLSVSIAAGTDGRVLFSATRSGETTRAYALVCGS